MRTRWPILYLEVFPKSWRRNSSFRIAWTDWLVHRKRIKRKMTDYAAKLQAGKLTKELNKTGSIEEAIAMINQSRGNGWTGLFTVKDWEGESRNSGGRINVGYQGD